MALQEVSTVPNLTTEQNYEIVNQHFSELKQHISDCIEFEDFETLDSYDINKIKELYFTRAALFWQLKDEAVTQELNEIKAIDSDYKHNPEYCRLMIKKFEYYNNQVQNEFKAKGDLWMYNKRFKPVIDNQISNWKGLLDAARLRKNKIENGLLEATV